MTFAIEAIMGAMFLVALAIMIWPEKKWPNYPYRFYNRDIDDQQGV
jgi:hypothetical protein